ncbi:MULTISPECIES: MFS transporter [unclassified Bradyrhizobium]
MAIFAGSAARVLPALLAVTIQQDRGLQPSDVFLPITLGIVVSACASPFAAYSLERCGVRAPLIASLALLATSLAWTTCAASPWHLTVAWGLGFGFSGSLSASLLGAMAGSRGDAVHCGTRFGFLASMQPLGSAAGLLLASRAANALDWRFVFQAAAFGVLATAFAVSLSRYPDEETCRESPSPSGTRHCVQRRRTGGSGSLPRSSASAARRHPG